MASDDDLGRWRHFRAQLPVTRRWAYLDHAAVAPLPQPTAEAINDWVREASQDGDTCWPRWSRRIRDVRLQVAALLNAEAAEVAFVPSTTYGLSLVAEGFPWKPGDNVVTLDNEFPSNLYPWLNLGPRGVTTRRVATLRGRVDCDRLLEACDERTRIVAVSWVGYASGWRLDVGRLVEQVHQRGALVCLDAIQGLGVFPLDVRQTNVDFLAADGHKWLLGPEGAGIFFLQRRHLELLRPLGVGWQSVEQPYEFHQPQFRLREEAARYEGGSHNTVGCLGLGTSLDLLREVGLGPKSTLLADRVRYLTQWTVERLNRELRVDWLFERQATHDSGILTFGLPGRDPTVARAECLARGIVVSCRGGGLRISLHAYNNEDDVERLIAALRA